MGRPARARRGQHPDPDDRDGRGVVHAAAGRGALAGLRRRGDLEQPDQPAQPDDGSPGTRLDDGHRAADAEPRLLHERSPTIRSRSTFRSQRSSRQAAFYDPRTGTQHAGGHLLQHAPSAVRRRQGPHAVFLGRHQRHRLGQHAQSSTRRETPRGRRDGVPRSSTRTATARSASTRSRISRAIRARTCAWPASPTASSSTRPTDRSGGRTPGVPGRVMRLEIGSNPPLTCRAEVYEPPFDPPTPNGIGGHTPRGIDVDRNGVHLDRALRRAAPGVVRSPQVQDAERTDRHRAALPRRLDAVSGARSADEGHRPSRQRGLLVLQLGRSVRHARPRARTCRS